MRLALSGIHTAPRGGAALRAVSLEVRAGEILAVLGPRNAGTSTVLRVAAGMVGPRAGRVLIDGRDAAGLSARQRGVVLVDRQPGRLAAWAGGVASMARALATRSPILLLDEPTSGLDAAEAEALFAQLRRARDGGRAIVVATSNPEHAIPLADRLAVLLDGGIRQQGAPQTVYERPADAEVARATGEVNLLPAIVLGTEGDWLRLRLDSGVEVEVEEAATGAGAATLLGIRPEHLALSAAPLAELGEGAIAAQVTAIAHYGPYARITLDLAGLPLVARRPAGATPPGVVVGRQVSAAWQPGHARLYAAQASGGQTQAVAAAVPPR